MAPRLDGQTGAAGTVSAVVKRPIISRECLPDEMRSLFYRAGQFRRVILILLRARQQAILADLIATHRPTRI